MSKPISGFWEFNDTITMDGWAASADATKEYVNFTTYKSDSDPSHIYIGFNLQHYNEYDNLQYLTSTTTADRSYVWAKSSTSTYDLGWQYEQRKIVNFGKTARYVSDAFYEWFTANATKIFVKTFTKLNLADVVTTSGGKSFRKLNEEETVELAGTWLLNEYLSTPTESATFYLDGTFYGQYGTGGNDVGYRSLKRLFIRTDWQVVSFSNVIDSSSIPRALTYYNANDHKYCRNYQYTSSTASTFYSAASDTKVRTFTITSSLSEVVDANGNPNGAKLLEWLKANATKVG